MKKYIFISMLFLLILLPGIILLINFDFKKFELNKTTEIDVYENKSNELLNENQNIFVTKDIKPISYSASVPIFMYHWLREDTGGYEYPEMMVKPSELEKQFEYVSKNGYQSIFITDIGKIYDYEKPVAFTFDDGWVDVYIHAFEFAKKYNVKFSMYVITDFVGTSGYCTKEQLKEMAESGLVQIDSHTVNHYKLATLTEDEIYNELKLSKEYLKNTLDLDSKVICYPSGSRDARVINIAKKLGYEYGLAMDGGIYYTDKHDIMEIARIFLTRSTTLEKFISYIEQTKVEVEWE